MALSKARQKLTSHTNLLDRSSPLFKYFSATSVFLITFPPISSYFDYLLPLAFQIIAFKLAIVKNTHSVIEVWSYIGDSLSSYMAQYDTEVVLGFLLPNKKMSIPWI